MTLDLMILFVLNYFQEQDKSSDIEQQPPFGDRKISNIQPQNRGLKFISHWPFLFKACILSKIVLPESDNTQWK